MEKHELTLILDGKATPAKVKAVNEKLSGILSLLKGKIVRVDEWGKRELMGRLKKSSSGFYLSAELELVEGTAKKLLEKLRTEEDVLRHLLIKS